MTSLPNNLNQDLIISQSELSSVSSFSSSTNSPSSSLDLERQGQWKDRNTPGEISGVTTLSSFQQDNTRSHQKLLSKSPHDNEGRNNNENMSDAAGCEKTGRSSLICSRSPSTATTRAIEKQGSCALLEWFQVLGAFLALINSWGWYGVFKTFYNLVLLSDRPLFHIAWIGSIHMFLVTFVGVFVANRLVAHGYTRLVNSIGLVTTTFGMMMVSLSSRYYQIVLSQGVVMGIGCAFSTAAAIPTINAFFAPTPQLQNDSASDSDEPSRFCATFNKYRRSIAVGLASTGGAIGGIIYPAMNLRIIPQISFPVAAKVTGAIIFATLLAALLLLRPLPSSPPRKTWRWTALQDKNLPGDELSVAASLRAVFAVRGVLDFSALRDANFVLLAAGTMVFNAGLYVPIFFISQFGIAYGASLNYAFYLLPVLNAGSAVGRFLPALMSQTLGPLNAILVSMAACVAMGFAWISVQSSAKVAVFAVFYGLASGTFMALPGACFGAIAPSPAAAGRRTNLGALIAAAGILIGPPIGGLLLRAKDTDFQHAQIYTGVLMAAGGVLVLAARMSFARGQLVAKV